MVAVFEAEHQDSGLRELEADTAKPVLDVVGPQRSIGKVTVTTSGSRCSASGSSWYSSTWPFWRCTTCLAIGCRFSR